MSDLPPVPLIPYLAARVTTAGISAPPFADVLASIQTAYRLIFGADVDIDPDTQDGQLLSIFAKAMSDANAAAIFCYNSYSPSTAVGAGLSSVVKINGIRRKIPTNSTAIVRVIGTAGTTIVGGVVSDQQGHQWSLPSSVVIPFQGEIQVTAVCQTVGAVTADIATINHIVTPVPGWQVVSNDLNAAVPGAPVEPDAQLRRRQNTSVAIAAQSVLDGIVGAVWGLDLVVRATGYENPLDYPAPPARPNYQPPSDLGGNTLPSHSIAIVVQGGVVADICNTIAIKKTPGSMTTGDVSMMILDQYGIPNIIKYWQLIVVPLTVRVTVTALAGYNSATSALIQGSVEAFVNSLDIGETSYHNRLFAPANLQGDPAIAFTGMTQPQLDAISNTFNIAMIEQGIMQPYMGFDVESALIDGFEIGSWTPRVVLGQTDIPLRFREAFSADDAHVSVVVSS